MSSENRSALIQADPISKPSTHDKEAEPARRGARFECQEEPMFKALLTPILLGLGVAMLIRMSSARRA
jgi:hypothetical protein